MILLHRYLIVRLDLSGGRDHSESDEDDDEDMSYNISYLYLNNERLIYIHNNDFIYKNIRIDNETIKTKGIFQTVKYYNMTLNKIRVHNVQLQNGACMALLSTKNTNPKMYIIIKIESFYGLYQIPMFHF